jgi:hypothetical protein
VRIEPGSRASRIDRSDRQREVRLRASCCPAIGQADRIAALSGAVREMNLPPATRTASPGARASSSGPSPSFLWVFFLSVCSCT